MKINKITIGCANFGNTYGLNEKNLSKKKFWKIAKYAFNNKLFSFDTAYNYGNSQIFLGQIKDRISSRVHSKIKIDSKIPKNSTPFQIYEIILTMLSQLNINSLNIVYFHDAKNLLGKNGKKIFEQLQLMKNIKIINKIGVSVYSVTEINKIIQKYKIDSIQIPVNVLDKRFINRDLLKKLKRKKIEIIARSIFLKGLLTKRSQDLPNHFHKFKNVLNKFDYICSRENVSKVKYCLDFVAKNSSIDRFIIGVSSEKQLKEILNKYKKKRYYSKLRLPNIVSRQLLDPRNWKSSF